MTEKRHETITGATQNGTPEVSVVMPSFNQAAFIERSVHSVFEQADDICLELIVMDGGSTDETQAILERLSQKYGSRIRWSSEPDRGPAHAVNKAMSMARGEIIGWLNSDDLYAPGAVSRAVEAIRSNPGWLMVYGHGEHIDEDDQPLGPYPTLKPEVGLGAFADGCFICQPTVFLRKSAVEAVGPLDESLKTAFDFEWWLRMFSRNPERIGFVNALQAQSRLHVACITLGQRQSVIGEGMKLLARYLGAAPLHWFKTYVTDSLADCPHRRQIAEIRTHLEAFGQTVSECLSSEDRERLEGLLDSDVRIRIAIPDAFLDVYPDGWLPPEAALRVQNPEGAWSYIVITGRHLSRSGPLRLTVQGPDGNNQHHVIGKRGPFSIKIRLPESPNPQQEWTFTLTTRGGFVPSAVDPGSDDHRELTCRVEGIQLHRSLVARLFRGTWDTLARPKSVNAHR